MEEMVNAGPGTPQGTVFAEYNFAAVDKNLSVEEAAGSLVGFLPVYSESLTPEEKETMTAEFTKACFTDVEGEIKRTSFLAACVPFYSESLTPEEKETMTAEFIKACFTDVESEIKCASFLAACVPTPFEAAEIHNKMLETALDAMRSALDDHIDRARRLIHHVRRNIGLERSTLKPIAFTLDWLDLVVRRRRRIGATIATVDRLFSASSCGGWSL